MSAAGVSGRRSALSVLASHTCGGSAADADLVRAHALSTTTGHVPATGSTPSAARKRASRSART